MLTTNKFLILQIYRQIVYEKNCCFYGLIRVMQFLLIQQYSFIVYHLTSKVCYFDRNVCIKCFINLIRNLRHLSSNWLVPFKTLNCSYFIYRSTWLQWILLNFQTSWRLLALWIIHIQSHVSKLICIDLTSLGPSIYQVLLNQRHLHAVPIGLRR